MGRGAFIVIEGCDRTGKSTQCLNIVEALTEKEIPAEYMKFPDRSTLIGKLINDYLCSRVELNDKTIHLLFSANRWELESKIRSKIKSGVTLIVDRYAFSGVVYSAVKPGMDIDWCKSPETGLPKPDAVLYLHLTTEELKNRCGFGKERYEKSSIQGQVADVFDLLKDSSWKLIHANKTEEELVEEMLPIVLETMEAVKDSSLNDLWGEERNVIPCGHAPLDIPICQLSKQRLEKLKSMPDEVKEEKDELVTNGNGDTAINLLLASAIENLSSKGFIAPE